MSEKRIPEMIDACKDCPHRLYDECSKTGAQLVDKNVIPAFCPLPVYPAEAISQRDRTIKMLRDGKELSVGGSILSHAASRLNTTVWSNGGGLTIKTKDGEIQLSRDYITKVDHRNGAIRFTADGVPPRNFMLVLDAPKPTLYELFEKTEGTSASEIDL